MATNSTATPDILDNAIDASTAGHPVAAAAAPSADILDSTIDASLAGRPVSSAPATPPAPETSVWGRVQSAANAIGEGGAEAARDVWPQVKSAAANIPPMGIPTPDQVVGAAKGIWHALPPVQLTDAIKQTLPVIDQYEKARAGGASISDAIKSTDDLAKQHQANILSIKPAVDAFRANPTRETARVVYDAAAAALALFGPGEVAGALAPEAAAAPAAEAVGSPSWLQRMNPWRASVAAPAEAAAATSKIEPAVAAQTAKAGLAPGTAEVTSAEATAANAQAKLDAAAATQKNIDSTLQDIAGRHAQTNGIPSPAAGTATRDVLTNNGDALVEAGKKNYQILDKYTDGKFTNAQAELKNAQQELRTKAGMTDVDTGDLEANVTRAQWNVDHLFDQAVQAGMPKETADLARTQFRTGQATLDAANDVRMANKVTGEGTRATNLNTLENRWTARYDSGRLQQAFGDQGAKDALLRVHAARETAEVLEAMPPTESKALQQLIENHTTTGRFGAATDWKAVRKEFSALPDRAARFSDVPKVEQFINRQNLYQNVRTGVKWAAIAGTAHALGVDKFLIHFALGG